MFVIDLLNFSFWNDEPYHVLYEGNRYTGYWSLCAAINRALKKGISITTPAYYAQASEEELRSVFETEEGQIPMVDERVRILKEAGQILMVKFNGSVTKMIESAEGLAQKFIELLYCNFHSFFDVSWYHRFVQVPKSGFLNNLLKVL